MLSILMTAAMNSHMSGWLDVMFAPGLVIAALLRHKAGKKKQALVCLIMAFGFVIIGLLQVLDVFSFT